MLPCSQQLPLRLAHTSTLIVSDRPAQLLDTNKYRPATPTGQSWGVNWFQRCFGATCCRPRTTIQAGRSFQREEFACWSGIRRPPPPCLMARRSYTTIVSTIEEEGSQDPERTSCRANLVLGRHSSSMHLTSTPCLQFSTVASDERTVWEAKSSERGFRSSLSFPPFRRGTTMDSWSYTERESGNAFRRSDAGAQVGGTFLAMAGVHGREVVVPRIHRMRVNRFDVDAQAPKAPCIDLESHHVAMDATVVHPHHTTRSAYVRKVCMRLEWRPVVHVEAGEPST
mmetsp:Transcript_7815/g.48445  ORF Transcript_7815/g.48445 Transcript_7815/m.48445 type:complete len:283 (+) Transcript_7815:1861-2709(+)